MYLIDQVKNDDRFPGTLRDDFVFSSFLGTIKRKRFLDGVFYLCGHQPSIYYRLVVASFQSKIILSLILKE